ncbi:hypothetical protein OFO99_33715, partial [Escherichia coli]|nr:hypothetical protein [Escherichia coli]
SRPALANRDIQLYMFNQIDKTHDPALRSWIESANDPNNDFPIQNLPFCSFWGDDEDEPVHPGIAIGDRVFDLVEAARCGLIDGQLGD